MSTVPSAPPRGVLARLWNAPYLLLCLTVLFWAGNAIVGRAAHGVTPPAALAFWRWLLAFALVLPLAWPHLKRDAPELKRRWKLVIVLGLTGAASFGALLYWGLQYTTALNGILLQAAIPPLILLAAFVMFGERARPGQIAGVVLSLLGVLVIISQGRPWALAHIGLNIGDGAVMCGVILYSIYSALLRHRPPVHPLSLIVCTFAVAALALAPFYAAEVLSGRGLTPTPGALMAIAYVAVLPSVVSYLFFNRGVELIGAGHAGQFIHLMPVFGAVLAVLVLHETLHLYHLWGVLLIGAGIALSALRRRAPVAAADPG